MVRAASFEDKIVRIAPKPRMVRFRKHYGIFMVVVFALNLALAVIFLLLHVSIALVSALTCLYLAFVIRWFRSQSRPGQIKPVIILSPEGLTIDGAWSFGTIPWDEIAAVQPTRFLFVPTARIVPKDLKSLYARLGAGKRCLWMYRMPGGLGLSCIPFSESPQEIAATINDYRASAPDRFNAGL